MKFLPVSYGSRSLFRRPASTLLTVVSIGATVAVFAGVLALQQGFSTLFVENGREDVAVLLRPGATSEGLSSFDLERGDILLKTTSEFVADQTGAPLASAESYLAVRLRKHDGGETNVPIRGVQPRTFLIRTELEIVEGRRFEPGADEVIIGTSMAERIPGCNVGEVLVLNTTPFRVVGHFRCPGPFQSEVWGDLDRMMEALERPFYNRIIGVMKPEADLKALAARLEDHPQAPAKVLSERDYLSSQTRALTFILGVLGGFLAFVMGLAAVFTGTNTMLAAVASRTQEIGILLSLGYRPFAILTSFLLEALQLGLLGGVVGCLMVLPLNGVRTGTTNFETFTEVAFAFRVGPPVLITAVVFSLVLGVLAGLWPAARAARLRPTEALRRG